MWTVERAGDTSDSSTDVDGDTTTTAPIVIYRPKYLPRCGWIDCRHMADADDDGYGDVTPADGCCCWNDCDDDDNKTFVGAAELDDASLCMMIEMKMARVFQSGCRSSRRTRL